MNATETMSAAKARRVLLGAQGFAGTTPVGPHGARRIESSIRRIAPLQIDSVNVFARSHLMPLFSRLGPYDTAALDALAFGDRRRFTEYWARGAALIPLGVWPFWG